MLKKRKSTHVLCQQRLAWMMSSCSMRESNVLAPSYVVLIFLITLFKRNFIPSALLVTICLYYGVTTKVNYTNITDVKQ